MISEGESSLAPSPEYFTTCPTPAARAAAKYCDVISYNLYRREVAGFRLPEGIDRPVIIGGGKTAMDACYWLMENGVAPERISVSILEDCTSGTTSLLEEARNTGIGTIVTGRRHLSALESWLLGSVSRQLVNWARGMAVWVAA